MQNHSHFIFTNDGSVEQFGGETAFRSQLEACISEGQDFSKQILQRLQLMRLGWQGLNFRAIESDNLEDRRIPAVAANATDPVIMTPSPRASRGAPR